MTSTIGDAVRGFRAMASGALISARANRERTAPTTAGLTPFSSKRYYGLGVTVANGWQFQNPFIDGYTGVAAYLPAQDLSLGIATTQLPQSANNGVEYATGLFAKLTAYLSPAPPDRNPRQVARPRRGALDRRRPDARGSGTPPRSSAPGQR